MNTKKFSEAMGELDSKYVNEAINYKKKAGKFVWIKWGASVATIFCCFTMTASAFSLFSSISEDDLSISATYNGMGLVSVQAENKSGKELRF